MGRRPSVTAETAPIGLLDPRLDPSTAIQPFLKWPGGKSDELRTIARAAPPLTGRYIDPFVGGGSVLLAVPPDVKAWANDACADLIRLYELAASGPTGRSAFDSTAATWDGFIDLPELYAELAIAFRAADKDAMIAAVSDRSAALRRLVDRAGPGLADAFLGRLRRDLPLKCRRMSRIEGSHGTLSARDLVANVEGAVRAPFYMAVRRRYNVARLAGRWDALRSADFLFIREFAYAAMFRFNARGEFNVPYGGITYNRKSLAEKVELMFGAAMRARLDATEWRRLDFEAFLEEAAPAGADLVFVDPPYDSGFSSYDDLTFGWDDQRRLAHVLAAIPSRVMVVIKDTPMIRRLYGRERWRIVQAAKTYLWTIKSRNDRSATHLTITNY
jgi:DNA adenine methylase